MNIELPKDAEGREIPLDTKALYGKDGEGLDVRHFEFSPFSGKWIIAALKGGPCNWTGVYRSPQNVHLEKPTPPDSWEKLFEDLKAVADYGNSSHLDSPTCHYTHTVGKPCDKCKFYRSKSCISEMCADIAYRIRELRDEDK